jgi:nucleoid-associated protein YgaU
MFPTKPKFHHTLAIFLGLAVAAFAAESGDSAAPNAKDTTPAQTALAKLTAERDQLVASLNATTTELAALRARQAATAGQSAGDTEKLRSDLASITNELNEARAAARTLATKNQEMEDVASERGRALAAAQAELANVKNAPASAAALPQLAAMTAERDSLAEKLARSDRQIALLGSQNMRTLREMEDQKPQLAEAQAKIEKLAGENVALAAKLATVPAPTLDRSGEIEKLTAAQTAAEAHGQEFAARVAALEKQNTELTARATAAETKLATAATPAPTVAGDASTEEAKKQLAEIEARLTTALHSYSMLQQELDQTHEAAAKTETKFAASQAEAAALRTQVDALNPNGNEMVLLRQASINAATEAVELRDQLRQAQGSVAQLAEENAQLRTRLALLGPPPAPMLASPARFAPAPPPAAAVKSAPAQPPPQSSAAKPDAAPPAARQHVVVEGDTLSKISRHYYGTSDRWPEILEANRDILRDARNLPVGASLRIP